MDEVLASLARRRCAPSPRRAAERTPMLPDDAPSGYRDHRIIPLRRTAVAPAERETALVTMHARVHIPSATAAEPAAPDASQMRSGATADLASVQAALRRYLKLTLPGIPIAVFVLSFLYGAMLIQANSQNMPSETSASANATLPLVGALVLSLTAAMICCIIYWGCVRTVSDQ